MSFVSKIVILKFLLLFFLLLPSVTYASHPICDPSSVDSKSPVEEAEDVDGKDGKKGCPTNTCYQDSGTPGPTQYACYTITTAVPPPPPPPPPPTTDKNLNITVTDSVVSVKFNEVKGFGDFAILITHEGSKNIVPPSLKFKVSGGKCETIDFNSRSYPKFDCKILDPAQPTWSLEFDRINKFQSGNRYVLSLYDGKGTALASESFSVGTSLPAKLTVTINPSIIENTSDTQVTISYGPSVVGTEYRIDTTIPSVPTFPPQKCSASPCSQIITIPKGISVGKQTITVTEERDPTTFGSADIDIRGTISGGSTKLVCKDKNDKDFDPKKHQVCSSSAGQFCNPANNQRVDKDSSDAKGIYTAIGCIPTEPGALVSGLMKLAFGGAGGVALLLMVLGAFKIMTAAGNPESIKAGQEQFTSAVIGLLFIIFAVLLLEVVGVDILGIPGIDR